MFHSFHQKINTKKKAGTKYLTLWKDPFLAPKGQKLNTQQSTPLSLGLQLFPVRKFWTCHSPPQFLKCFPPLYIAQNCTCTNRIKGVSCWCHSHCLCLICAPSHRITLWSCLRTCGLWCRISPGPMPLVTPKLGFAIQSLIKMNGQGRLDLCSSTWVWLFFCKCLSRCCKIK